jgi:ATP-dependent 26S proteasome regulatory subunit
MYFSASFFADKYIGETSRRVRKAFDGARAHNKPVFVFIDELDALATKRKDSTHEEHRATLITLLTELQELQDNKNIFVFAATNDLEALDPAIKDRFAGSVCEIKQLTTEQKALLYKKMFADKNMKIDDIELVNRLAAVTNDTFSNRDIDYIVTTALLKKFADCQQNKRCDEHITKYVRLAMDSTGKTGSFYSRLNTKYGNGF